MFEIATGTRVPKFRIKSILVLEPIDMSAVYLSQNCGGIMRRADQYRHYAAECGSRAKPQTTTRRVFCSKWQSRGGDWPTARGNKSKKS